MTTFASKAVGFTASSGATLGISKHTNLAIYPADGKIYHHGGDVVSSSNQELFTYDWPSNTWAQIQNKCGSANPSWNGTLTDAANGLRPSQPDDGAWYWDATEARFWWLFGGGQLAQGGILSDNQCGDGLSTNPSQSYIQTATRWRGYAPMLFDPVTKKWSETTFTVALNGYSAIGGIYGAENASRGNAHDPVARKIFRIYLNGSQSIAVFDLAARTVTPYTMAALADDTGFNDASNQTLSYGHQAFAVDTSNGYLYCVVPHTGRLLQIRTRATPLPHFAEGTQRLPMYLLDNPITPIPGWRASPDGSGTQTFGSDHCFMRVFAGGLLYVHMDIGGIDGRPYGAYWRSLTNVATSKWVPFPMPSNFVANSVTTNTDSSGALYALGAYIDPPAFRTITPRIWRIAP